MAAAMAASSWGAAQGQSPERDDGTGSSLVLGEDGQWVQGAAPEPGSDAAVLAEVRSLIAADKPGKAFNIIDQWLDDHETSQNPLLARAYLLRGDARTADGDEYKALYDYETVINDFPSDSAFVDAVTRELEIGEMYLHGLRRKWFGLMRIENSKPLGTELLMRVQERLPGSRLAETAAVELADFFYREGELELAAQMYDILLRNFPQTEYRVHATERRIYSNIGQFKGPKYSAAGLVESRALIDDYRSRFPVESQESGVGDALVARIDHSAAAQMLTTSRWYLKRKDPVSARFTLRRLIRKHPSTAAAAEAVALLREHGWFDEQIEAEAMLDAPTENDAPDVEVEMQATPPPTIAQPEPSTPRIKQMTPIGGGR